MTEPVRTDVSSESSREEMGALLRGGVIAAAVITLAGAALLFIHGAAGTSLRFRHFDGEPDTLRSVVAVIRAAMHGDPRALIQTGILVLIATPVARVLFGVIAFLKARDWIYVAISAMVLVLLLSSLFLG